MSENTIKENMETVGASNDALNHNALHDDSDTPLQKPLKVKEKKPRKPKTEKQLQQFENARLKRQEKIKESKLNKKIEASKLLLEHGYQAPLTPVHHEPKRVDETTEEENSEDNEIIIIKKKKKPKKKTYIIQESSDDDSDDEEEKVKQIYNKSRQMVSQQNKKSMIKIHKPSHNYFVE